MEGGEEEAEGGGGGGGGGGGRRRRRRERKDELFQLWRPTNPCCFLREYPIPGHHFSQHTVYIMEMETSELGTFHVASLPGPAQFSIACSKEKLPFQLFVCAWGNPGNKATSHEQKAWNEGCSETLTWSYGCRKNAVNTPVCTSHSNLRTLTHYLTSSHSNLRTLLTHYFTPTCGLCWQQWVMLQTGISIYGGLIVGKHVGVKWEEASRTRSSYVLCSWRLKYKLLWISRVQFVRQSVANVTLT